MAGRAKFILIALISLFGIDLHAQGIPYQLNPPAPNARVQFCPVPDGGYPCPTLTTVYSDSAATQIINQPISLGSSGNLSVYFAAGTSSVTVQLLGQGYGPQNRFVTGIGGGGGGVSADYGPLAFSCANCKTDVQYAFAVTCNNTSTAISTGANDPPFVAGDVGKIIVGTSAANSAASCPPQGTITSFTDAHHVTVSNAATASVSNGSLGWGTQDDGPNLRNAFLASLGKGCFYLPAGAMFAGAAGSDSVNLFVDNRAATASGYPPCVIGQGNTIITPLPAFNYANCASNDACMFKFAQVNNANPNYGLFKDVELFLLGYSLTGSGTNNNWVNWQRLTLENIWLWSNFDFQGIGFGFSGAGPTSAFSPISFFAANTACSPGGSGASSAGLNQLVTINQGYCQSHTTSMLIGSTANVKTVGLQYGSPNTGNTISSSGIWDSWGEGIFKGNGTADSLRVGGGTTYLHGTWVVGGSGNTLGAIDCNASGATVVLDSGAVDGGGGGGLALRSIAGCNIKVRFPVTVLNYAASLAGNNISDPSETQTGACTTNAATVTFKLTYQVAPLVIVSDTTSASTGAQATSTNLTTATIHCNGASDTFVATVIPNPI